MRQDLHGHSPCGELLGTKILDVAADGDAIELGYEAGADFTNRLGNVAGAMIAAMLDSVTGLAALASLPEDRVAVHTALQVEYLKPARPGRMTGRGQVVERTDRDVRSRGELLDDDGVLVARAEASLRILQKRQA